MKFIERFGVLISIAAGIVAVIVYFSGSPYAPWIKANPANPAPQDRAAAAAAAPATFVGDPPAQDFRREFLRRRDGHGQPEGVRIRRSREAVCETGRDAGRNLPVSGRIALGQQRGDANDQAENRRDLQGRVHLHQRSGHAVLLLSKRHIDRAARAGMADRFRSTYAGTIAICSDEGRYAGLRTAARHNLHRNTLPSICFDQTTP